MPEQAHACNFDIVFPIRRCLYEEVGNEGWRIRSQILVKPEEANILYALLDFQISA